jgi:hypothetical protein
MAAFFLTVRILRLAFLTLRYAASIMILGHGVNRWVQNHR